MIVLKELFQEQRAGLTVYSPDCAQSRMWGNLDHVIHDATGFQIARRYWVQHDINSILRFYQEPNSEPPAEQDPIQAIERYNNIPADKMQYGHLVVKLLMQGPSLLTIWEGSNAISKLLEVKGVTQPAEADPGSIRGSFWCDNGICNLVHSSDTTAEALRELAVLRLGHWLEEVTQPLPLMDPTVLSNTYVAHSGISIMCDVVNRLLLEVSSQSESICLPESGSAIETNRQLTKHLVEIATNYQSVASFVNAFLGGDLIAVTNRLESLPVTRWEQFVIQCGTVNRDRWIEHSIAKS